MGEFRCESLVPPEPLPWRAAAPAWRARLQNQPLTLSVPLYRPHLHEPIIFATLVPSKHFSSPALLQFRSLIPIANWPPEYSQPKTVEFSNYRFVPLRVEQHTVCSAGHARGVDSDSASEAESSSCRAAARNTEFDKSQRRGARISWKGKQGVRS